MLVILLAGCLLALPNIYGSVPAVQIAHRRIPVDEASSTSSCASSEAGRRRPRQPTCDDGRVVLRFLTTDDQERPATDPA